MTSTVKNIQKVIIFLLVNALGFSSATICFYIGALTHALPPADDTQAILDFRADLFLGTSATWLVCALFSFAYFFLPQRERLVFLWLPVVIPMAYGLYVLYWP